MTRKKDGDRWPATAFGARLNVLMIEKGWSNATLSAAINSHPMTISKLRRGVQEPAWPLVLAICRAIGVSCQAFAGEDVPIKPVSPAKRSKPTTRKKKSGRKPPA